MSVPELEWTLQPGWRADAQTTLYHSHERFFQERLPWRLGLVRLEGGPTVVAHLHSRVARTAYCSAGHGAARSVGAGGV